ncbi:MAG: YeeE/YedE family protein [Burkholderiaceae bacterium]
MSIAWTSFTPWASLAGGLLIGLGVALLLLFNGRIAGISGIVGGLLRPVRGDVTWRAAFVAGLVAAPLVWLVVAALPRLHVAADTPTLVVAGLLVGIGTRYGSGCTSGHGVCGLSRGSLRSLAATASFMAAGFVVVFVVRHLLGH